MAALSADASNRSLVTAGLDGVLRVWDFRKQKLTGACACCAPGLLQSGHSGGRTAGLTHLTGTHWTCLLLSG